MGEGTWSEESTDECGDSASLTKQEKDVVKLLGLDAEWVARYLEIESTECNEIAEAESPDADDEWVPGLPEDEPETTIASEAVDMPVIAELETVDAETVESEVQYSPETDMPAFLSDLKPVNGTVEDGRLFAQWMRLTQDRLAAHWCCGVSITGLTTRPTGIPAPKSSLSIVVALRHCIGTGTPCASQRIVPLWCWALRCMQPFWSLSVLRRNTPARRR